MFKHRLIALDGLRAIAIFAVFNIHFMGGFYTVNYFAQNSFWRSFFATIHSGIFGVPLFLTLSGYLIYGKYIASKDNSNKNNSLSFILMRLLRLWPAYLVAVAFFLSIPTLNIKIHSTEEFIRNITLITLKESPTIHSFIPVAWTLALEFQYVAIVALVLLFPFEKRKRIYFGLLLLYGLLFINFSDLLPIYTPDNIFAFFLGSLLFELGKKNSLSKIPPVIPIILIVATTYIWGNYSAHFTSDLMHFVIMSSLCMFIFILLSSILNKETAISNFLKIKPLTYLGKISYSFYLVHYCIIGYILNYGMGFGSSMSGMFFRYFICLFFSIIASIALFLLAEYPYIKWHNEIYSFILNKYRLLRNQLKLCLARLAK